MSDETPADARARRLAEALRANLRRRKAQSRARCADAAPAGAAQDDPAPAPDTPAKTHRATPPETSWTA